MVCWSVEIAKSCITKPKFHQMLHLARHRSTCLWLTRYDGCMWFDSWLTDSVSWTLRCWDVDNFVKDWHHLRTGWVMSRTDSRSRNLSALTTRHWDLNSIYRRYVKTLLSSTLVNAERSCANLWGRRLAGVGHCWWFVEDDLWIDANPLDVCLLMVVEEISLNK